MRSHLGGCLGPLRSTGGNDRNHNAARWCAAFGRTSWISTRSAIGRHNFALALVGDEEVGRGEPLDVFALAERHGRGGDLKAIVGFYADLLLGELPSAAWQERILRALASMATPETGRQAVALILTSPETQLG